MVSVCKELESFFCAGEQPPDGSRWMIFGRSLSCCLGTIRSGYDALRILVVAVLLTAAGLKAYQLATEPIIGTGLLASRWLLIATVEFELLFGLWLLSGILPRLTWCASLACFGLFGAISLYKALLGQTTCGCFGRVAVNPWYSAALDLGIVVSLLRWQPTRLHYSIRRVPVAIMTWLLIGAPVMWAMGSNDPIGLSQVAGGRGYGKTIVLEPEEWIGKMFPLLEHVDIGDRLKEGDWLVLLYRHDCPDCHQAIQRILRDTPQKSVERWIAMVEFPPYAGTSGRELLSKSGMIYGRVDDSRNWFVTTPTELRLKTGKVVAVSVAGPPSSVVGRDGRDEM